MNLSNAFPGQNSRFEGDRTLMIRGLPVGATIRRAAITLTPVAAPGRELFVEELVFDGNQEPFGATKVPGHGRVEVDFHTRRTLAAVEGVNLGSNVSELLVDLGGGVFMEINQRGAIDSPDDDSDRFVLGTDRLLPGLLVSRFALDRGAGSPSWMDISRVTVRSVPTNVSLSVGDLAPFWVRPGEMPRPQTSTDFADVLQLVLNEAAVENGRYLIPLTVHSDSLARLDVAVQIEYVQAVSALPEGVGEVTLPYQHDGVAQSESVLQVALPVGARVLPGETSVRVLGSFDASRVLFGPTGPVDPPTAVAITTQQAQAQPILLDADLAATAVDLLLMSVSRAAVLDINLLGDVGGKPFADPLLPQPIALELDRDVAGTPTWTSVRLPTEFQFVAGQRVWLVVQAREGEAAWSAGAADAASAGLHQTTTGGLAWRIMEADGMDGRLSALFRLRHTPARYDVPLEVMVGAGDDAVRVALDRFRPLGRIDFDIDFPEFADAINQAAANAAKTACPQGEQMLNADLERWTSSGDVIGSPQPVANARGVQTIAIAPNGKWAYVGVFEQAGFLSLPFHMPDRNAVNSVVPASGRHIAIRADSTRIYIVTAGNRLHVVDAETRQALPRSVGTQGSVRAIALTPDGRRLYLLRADEYNRNVVAVDTAVLEQTLSSDQDATLADCFVAGGPGFANPLPMDAANFDLTPTAMVMMPDGRGFAVASVSASDAGFVQLFDSATHQPRSSEPVGLGNRRPSDLACTPDGQTVLAVFDDHDTVELLHGTSLLTVGSVRFATPSDLPLSTSMVVVAPDGRRAFAAHAGNQSIGIIDLVERRVEQTLTVGAPDNGDMSLAVMPLGDRLYVTHLSTDEANITLSTVPLGQQTPDDWTLTTGFVTPLCYADPHKLTAVLGPFSPADRDKRPSRPSALSQVVPAVGGCGYTFSFWAIACDLDAMAEIIWMGDGCSLQQIDRVPIERTEAPDAPVFERRLVAGARQSTCLQDHAPDLVLHRARFTAPAGATQAEIRFLVPPQVLAAVDGVSFEATQDAVVNNDLRYVEAGELAGWRLVPETATGLLPTIDEAGVRLQNAGSAAAALVQSFDATAAQPFQLAFDGEVVAQLDGRGAPRIELHWLAEDGSLTGEMAQLAISTAADRLQLLDGTVPVGAAGAELHLVIPGGTTLAVDKISFQPIELVQVPIQFLAQSPGTLTLTDFRVAYEEAPAVARPAPPVGGLCDPTPPGRSPGGKAGGCPWCPQVCSACGSPKPETGTEATPAATAVRVLPLTRRSLAARSRPLRVAAAEPVVGSAPAVRPIEAEIAAIMPASEAGWAALAGDLAVVDVPLTAVDGIGESRAARLRALRIDTLVRLAEAQPAVIAADMAFVNERVAAEFIAEARAIRADPAWRQTPLVSCVMPTADRPQFVRQAIDMFLRQDYPRKELIVVDDGDEPVEALLADDERIRILRSAVPLTVGAKRNLGFAAANGAILANWDDDIWTADWRLSYQVANLLQRDADLCGLTHQLHYDLITGLAWHSVAPRGGRPWMPGGTLCFRRAFWEAHPFEDRDLGEDIAFVRSDLAAHVLALQSIAFQVDIIHGANTSPKESASPLWFPYPVAEIEALMGADWAFYAELAQASGLQPG